MLTYVIVFQYILKTGSSGEYPYVVWFLPGMSMWMYCSDAILTASNSIRNYSYLVKKVVFPVDIIPVISLTSSSFIGIFLMCIAIVITITDLKKEYVFDIHMWLFIAFAVLYSVLFKYGINNAFEVCATIKSSIVDSCYSFCRISGCCPTEEDVTAVACNCILGKVGNIKEV